MKHILIAFGTRPEVIKLAPVVHELKKHCKVSVLHTGQHQELVEPMLKLFNIEPDLDLNIMKPGQDLFDLSQSLLPKLGDLLSDFDPDFVMVQGDTSTSFLTALAAFYLQIPVLHIEAGLRSHNPYYPFPEEMNRKQITHLTQHHFAPTSRNKENLLKEGILETDVTVTGNTVIDALQLIRNSESYKNSKPEILDQISSDESLIVLTTHRRENHGKPMVQIFKAVDQLIANHKNLKIIFPAHPNPAVQKVIKENSINSERFLQTNPYDYLSFLHILERSNLILTDSGGIQEEAASLGKPVLVLRGETERQELIDSGAGELVGTDTQKIIERAGWYLTKHKKNTSTTSLFGDGDAAIKIRKVIDQL
ncbi:MAG: UDP-N-acetylglucosamine 2-epimerase (non-hydrolyzing) [Gracilimonas sp.]|nr:UDP-N-acetylglucosamine 2-epimerase (non-hydrolyzing) [Gracilimonas sp.]